MNDTLLFIKYILGNSHLFVFQGWLSVPSPVCFLVFLRLTSMNNGCASFSTLAERITIGSVWFFGHMDTLLLRSEGVTATRSQHIGKEEIVLIGVLRWSLRHLGTSGFPIGNSALMGFTYIALSTQMIFEERIPCLEED